MNKINYVAGDATDPQGPGPKIICHVCNDCGGWGQGFVNAISRRWKQPEREYRQWHAGGMGCFGLGKIQIVQVRPDLRICNMVAQHKYRTAKHPVPLQYMELRSCLQQLCHEAQLWGATVHCPRLGAGLAGGNWLIIRDILHEELCAHGVSVTVYDLEAPK